ncbi:uncharacterized protein M8220_003011 isoform 1-T1 [Acridotheres tristis]
MLHALCHRDGLLRLTQLPDVDRVTTSREKLLLKDGLLLLLTRQYIWSFLSAPSIGRSIPSDRNHEILASPPSLLGPTLTSGRSVLEPGLALALLDMGEASGSFLQKPPL